MDWLDLLAAPGTLKSLIQHHSSKASIFRHSALFTVQLSHPHMTSGKTIALTRWTFVGKVMSLLFNMLSRLVITFLPRSKHLLISWLQSPSAVILEPKTIKSDTVSTVSPSISHEVMGPDAYKWSQITSPYHFIVVYIPHLQLHTICQQIWKTQQWPQDQWSVFITIPKKSNAKECLIYHTVALISHASKVMLKILQARIQQYVNCELHMFKLVLEKAEEPKIKLPTSAGSSKKQESSRKTSISALWTMPKPLTVWITINCGKFWKRWEYQTPWPASWEICVQVKKQQLELDLEQHTNSKSGKECVKAVYCHPTYLTHMQSTSWEILGWVKHKVESRFPGESSITSDMQMTPPLWQKAKN